MMLRVLACLLGAALLLIRAAHAAPDQPRAEQVQSDISTREILIRSDFTGIEIVLFGSIDFSRAPSPDDKPYDVIMVVRAPQEPVVVWRKEQVAGIWVNGESRTFPSVPGFYAVLGTRPFRAIAPSDTLEKLGIGLSSLDFGVPEQEDAKGSTFRASLIRLRKQEGLFQESDSGVSFLGRSLFRGSVKLPVNVPVGRYTTQVYLFRDGELLSQSQGSLQVYKVGFEHLLYVFAFRHPFFYGLAAVLMAMTAGLLAWVTSRRS